MKILITTAAAVGAAAVAMAAAASGSPAAKPIKVVQHDQHFGFVDVAPKQGEQRPPTQGDTFVIGSKLTQGSKAVGTAGIVCVTTTPGARGAQSCTGTITLAKGTITIAGVSHIATNSDTFAITGGTGTYSRASGTVVGTTGRGGTTNLAIKLN